MDFEWTVWNGVPIPEQDKQRWAESCIKRLKKDPKQRYSGISSGESYVHVERTPFDYIVTEYKIVRVAYVKRDPDDVDPCTCSLRILNQTGCKCGGV